MGNAELFVLPSHSENFGLVVAESLAYCVPVVTTRATPWNDLESYECGWWVDDDRESVKNALVDVMALTTGDRKQMGRKGRSVIERKYSWHGVAQQMADVYDWVLGGGSAPNCVQL